MHSSIQYKIRIVQYKCKIGIVQYKYKTGIHFNINIKYA